MVETSRGGSSRGGAKLTGTGREVLDRYRRMMVLTETVIAAELTAVRSLLVDRPDER